jgi:hypothetical protein
MGKEHTYGSNDVIVVRFSKAELREQFRPVYIALPYFENPICKGKR